MIAEDYVHFEVAKLLKENGFREWCRECYGTDVRHNGVSITFDEELDLKDEGRGDEIEYVEGGIMHSISCNNSDKDIYAAPTLQMAMKWLREVHKLGVFPTTFYREMGNNVKHDYGSTIVRLDTFEIIGNKNVEDYTFAADTYEGTTEKAIKYCLENLI